MAKAIAKTDGRAGATAKVGGKVVGKGKGKVGGKGKAAGKGRAGGKVDGIIEGERRRGVALHRWDASDAQQSGRNAVRIRAVEQRDGAALATLRRQNEQAHARLLPDYFRVAPGPTATELKPNASLGPSSLILVAEESGHHEGPIRGYVSVKVVDTPRDPTMTPRRRAHVDEIVVDEGHRGGGIGTALMHAAAALARRHEAVELVLTVWSDNRAAEGLYKRQGFQPIARVLRRKLDP